MVRITLITSFLLLSSLLFAGCLFQRSDQVSPTQNDVVQPAPSIAPIPSTSSSPAVASPSANADDQDNGLSPVQGDQVYEGEEVVQ